MSLNKNRKYDLKKKRDKALKFAIIFSLSLFILAFKYIPPDNEPIVKEIDCSFGGIGENNFIVCSAPEPPTNPRCPILISPIDDSPIDDIEFCTTELDLNVAVNYPPPPLYDSLEHEREDAIVWFDTPEQEPLFSTPILERPKPIGGMVGIHKRLDYPLTAIDNKIEGRVILRAFISEKGDVYKINVIRSLSPECDEAAIKAVKETKFIPTKNKGKAIKSTIPIPIMFKLN